MIDLLTYTSTIVAIFIAFCGFTCLYGKGNPLYSWAEFSYLAAGTAMSIIMAWDFIRDRAILGLMGGEWIWVIAIILGIMMWFRVHPKYSYVSRVPISLTIGIGLALSLRTTIFSDFLMQISATVVNLWVPAEGIMYTIARTTIAVCVITMMSFFIYTTKMKGPLLWSATVGEYLMYIGFGAAFAKTLLGRFGLFIGHMFSYMYPVWQQPYTLALAVLVFIIMIALHKTGLAEKLEAA